MRTTTMGICSLLLSFGLQAAEPLTLGLNEPRTGNYKAEALELRQGALLAIDRVNAEGGVLGRPLALSSLNAAGDADRARDNVDQFASRGVRMVFGGATSEEALAAGARARERGVLYFPTLAYANEVTGRHGHRYLFREANSAWMSAKVLGQYLSWHQPRRRYHYVFLDDAWGRSMEEALRQATGSRDRARNGYTAIAPGSRREQIAAALEKAKASSAESLVVILLGNDLVQAMQIAHGLQLGQRMQLIVPNLTPSVIQQAGPAVMENVIGTLAWTWQVPKLKQNPEGEAFVEAYLAANGSYPGPTAASAYGIVREWAEAVRRAGSQDPEAVIAALEGHRYRRLKDEQQWRAFDHQNVQSIFAVKVRRRAELQAQDHQRQDYFRIIHEMSGEDAAPSQDDWEQERGEELTLN